MESQQARGRGCRRAETALNDRGGEVQAMCLRDFASYFDHDPSPPDASRRHEFPMRRGRRIEGEEGVDAGSNPAYGVLRGAGSRGGRRG